MKGLELPINVLVVVAVAVIVLLGVVTLFFLGFGPFSKYAGLEAIKNDACIQFTRDCNQNPANIIVNFDADKDGEPDPGTGFNAQTINTVGDTENQDNLMTLCYQHFGAKTANDCRHLCVCPGY